MKSSKWQYIVIIGLVLIIVALTIMLVISLSRQSSKQEQALQFEQQAIGGTWGGGGGYQLIFGVPDTMTPVPLKITIPDAGDDFGALDVYVQDQHTPPFMLPLHFHSGITTTLTVAASAGDWTLSVTAGHGITAGDDIIMLTDYTWWYGDIYTATEDTLTLTAPINGGIAAGTVVEKITEELALDASIVSTTTIAHSVTYVDLDVTGFHIFMACRTEPDDSKFCDQAALERGLSMYKFDGETANLPGLGNYKSNGDLALVFGSVTYTDKAGGGDHGVRGVADVRGDFGVTIRLRGSTDGVYTLNGRDEIHMVLQDDLSGLGSLRAVIIGHVVD